MKRIGTSALIELLDCNEQLLDSVKFVEKALTKAARILPATIVASTFHKFNPHGVSGVLVICESHISIHTWVEYAYAAVDIFTCGSKMDFKLAAKYLSEVFESNYHKLKVIEREI